MKLLYFFTDLHSMIQVFCQSLLLYSSALLVLISTSCNTSRTKTTNKDILTALVNDCTKDAGYPLEKLYNYDRSYLLLGPDRSKRDDKIRVGNNKFYIIHVKDSKVIFKEEIAGGLMSWINPEEIEIYYPSGIPGKERSMIYNVRSNTKRSRGPLR